MRKKTKPHEQGKFAQLTLDFAFKKIFASEEDKDLLIALLNIFLKKKLAHPITNVVIKNPYIAGQTKGNRDANLDIRCRDSKGNSFIVEMQVGWQTYFIKRSLYYSSMAIVESNKKGRDWDFNYPNVYSLNFLDFKLNFGKNNDDIVQYISFSNEEHPEIRYDYENFVFVRLPEFKKELSECKTLRDKLLFFLCNSHKLKEQPESLRGKFFDKLFDVAKIANFTRDEYSEYEANRMTKLDYQASIICARREGESRGVTKGREEIFSLLESGMSLAAVKKKLGYKNAK